MKYDLEEMLYINDLIRCYNLCFCNSLDCESDFEWYSNYQLCKLIIELKKFFEENSIDYQIDFVKMFKEYNELHKSLIEGCYEYMAFADYVLYCVFVDLKHLSIRLCIDSVDELRTMYNDYDVFPYLHGIGVDIYQDFYTLYFSDDGYSWNNIEGAEDIYEEWIRELVGIEGDEINIYDYLDELVDACDVQVLCAISEGRLTDFIWYEPYRFVQMLNEVGMVYETANVQQLSV